MANKLLSPYREKHQVSFCGFLITEPKPHPIVLEIRTTDNRVNKRLLPYATHLVETQQSTEYDLHLIKHLFQSS